MKAKAANYKWNSFFKIYSTINKTYLQYIAAVCSGGSALLLDGHFHPGCDILPKNHNSSSSGVSNVILLCLQNNLKIVHETFLNICMYVCTVIFIKCIPWWMNFPSLASKEAKRITAFNIHAMYFVFGSNLKTINTI